MVLLFVSIIVIGIGGYSYLNSPKYVMLNYFEKQLSNNKFSTALSKFNKSQINTSVKSIISSSSIKDTGVSTTEKEEEIVNGSSYINNDDSKYYLNYSIFSDGKKMPIEIYFENNKLYLKFLGQFIYLDLTDISYEKISDEELKELTSIIKDSILYDMTDKLFKKVNSTLNLDNKKINADKYVIKLTNEDIYNYLEKVVIRIDSSKKIPKIKNMIFKNITKDEILKTIKEQISKNLNDLVIEYSMYISDKKIIRNEFSVIEKNDSLVYTFDSIDKGSNKNKYVMSINYSNNSLLNAVYEENDNNNSTISVNYADMYIINGTISGKDFNEIINLSLFTKDNMKDALGKISVIMKEVKKDQEYSFNAEILVPSLSYKFSINNNIILNPTLPKFNTNGAKKLDLNSNTLNNLL